MSATKRAPRVTVTQGNNMVAINDRLVAYRVWDGPTRWFHWINALSVLGLILVGILIVFAGSLGVSAAGRVTVKTAIR